MNREASSSESTPQPAEYSVEFLIETPEGFHVLARGEHLAPKDFMAWTRAASKALAEQGFKPVRRDAPAPPAAAESAPATARRGGGQGRPAPKYTGEVYEACPWCQADVYDNRQKKAQQPGWKGPWFKCKDECGFVVFKNNGEANE